MDISNPNFNTYVDMIFRSSYWERDPSTSPHAERIAALITRVCVEGRTEDIALLWPLISTVAGDLCVPLLKKCIEYNNHQSLKGLLDACTDYQQGWHPYHELVKECVKRDNFLCLKTMMEHGMVQETWRPMLIDAAARSVVFLNASCMDIIAYLDPMLNIAERAQIMAKAVHCNVALNIKGQGGSGAEHTTRQVIDFFLNQHGPDVFTHLHRIVECQQHLVEQSYFGQRLQALIDQEAITAEVGCADGVVARSRKL